MKDLGRLTSVHISESEEFTIPFQSRLPRLLTPFLPELVQGHAQTRTTRPSIQLPDEVAAHFPPGDTWNPTPCSGDRAKGYSFVPS